ncbi:MAG: hypothetical protein NVV66_18650 [Cellulomonas sp.]|uniref:hypothetical protein n=1 Tax=Cellulomonas sp. TaxID=40001 RepID=UPI00258638FD|nr:hypothetical protein [Cellulomonas sp.]MCR6706616.1 hypothetical protein [Cellulomonas sp.]
MGRAAGCARAHRLAECLTELGDPHAGAALDLAHRMTCRAHETARDDQDAPVDALAWAGALAWALWDRRVLVALGETLYGEQCELEFALVVCGQAGVARSIRAARKAAAEGWLHRIVDGTRHLNDDEEAL